MIEKLYPIGCKILVNNNYKKETIFFFLFLFKGNLGEGFRGLRRAIGGTISPQQQEEAQAALTRLRQTQPTHRFSKPQLVPNHVRFRL